MKAYKVTVLVIDLDEIGQEEIETVIENTTYPNRCISPTITAIEKADIGEWSDEHPLNGGKTWRAEYQRLFRSDGEPEPSPTT